MRLDPDFLPGGPQTVPIDRAVTLLMPAGFDAHYAGSEVAVAEDPRTAPAVRAPECGPSLRQRLVGFLMRPNRPAATLRFQGREK